MSNVVIKVSGQKILEMRKFYQNYLSTKKAPYTEFMAKKDGTTITAYSSGKVMFQGGNAENEAGLWGNAAPCAPAAKGKAAGKSSSGLPQGLSQMSLIGSDEVGNGSYFGPLVVCAVYADKEHLAPLAKLGVKDSKMLTDQQIRQMAPKIEALVPAKKLIVTPEKYNEIQPKYNAVRMKVALHNQAIYLLQQQIAPAKAEGVLIDQFTPEGNYRKYLQSEARHAEGPLYFVTKGEQYHLAVAAASILCRATFLEELDNASHELGLTVPSGAGTKSDEVAARILEKGGIDLLSKYVKLHFANTEKAKKIAARRK